MVALSQAHETTRPVRLVVVNNKDGVFILFTCICTQKRSKLRGCTVQNNSYTTSVTLEHASLVINRIKNSLPRWGGKNGRHHCSTINEFISILSSFNAISYLTFIFAHVQRTSTWNCVRVQTRRQRGMDKRTNRRSTVPPISPHKAPQML